jgi:hypothetical protein
MPSSAVAGKTNVVRSKAALHKTAMGFCQRRETIWFINYLKFRNRGDKRQNDRDYDGIQVGFSFGTRSCVTGECSVAGAAS